LVVLFAVVLRPDVVCKKKRKEGDPRENVSGVKRFYTKYECNEIQSNETNNNERAYVTLLFQIIALCDDELQSLAQHNIHNVSS
jgi:hypothetical protein